MLKIKKVLSLFLILAVITTFTIAGSPVTYAAGTGTGLAEHCLNAYYGGWSYVYGSASYGAVDCSGLIYMYSGCGSRVDMVGSSPEYGSTAYGIPNIHGLGLYQPGHVGVYVGGGMAVDARDEYSGVVYQSVYSKNWTTWFKVAGVSYPTNGWEYFNGNYYYYENGEYLTDTYITVDGISYYLDSTGASSATPGDTSGVADSGTDSGLIKLGSSGDKVTEIQLRLIELGFYSGPVTGYFGELTEAAYMRFQTAAGILVDGIAGSDTDILFSDSAPTGSYEDYEEEDTDTDTDTDTEQDDTQSSETTEEVTTPSSTYTSGDYNDDVYKIQTELAGLGYFNNEATGYYGDMTSAAVTEFQKQNGLETTGDVDELTYATLFSSTALENPEAGNDEDSGKQNLIAPPEATDVPVALDMSLVSPTDPTEIVMKSVQLASKALDGVSVRQGEAVSNSSNRSATFIIWLAIMVVFMGGAFFIVFTSENKKKKAKFERIKARANRNW